jgi:hypothetical protein
MVENDIIKASFGETDKVTKSAQNILIIILIPKTDDRRAYSIVQWTIKSVFCLTSSFQRWVSWKHYVIFSEFNAT